MSLETQPMVFLTGSWKRLLGATMQVRLPQLMNDMLKMNIANEEPNALIVYKMYRYNKSLLGNMADTTNAENERNHGRTVLHTATSTPRISPRRFLVLQWGSGLNLSVLEKVNTLIETAANVNFN